MHSVLLVVQVLIALAILNVWLLRRKQPSPWRGGCSANLREEFAVYGLGPGVMTVVGILKVTLAVALIVGVWRSELTQPAAFVLALFMLSAVAMHVRVSDPAKKSLPAATLLILCVLVGWLSA
jgi:uncharacterized membrane protein YphA (DoxX/SURF4 family)